MHRFGQATPVAVALALSASLAITAQRAQAAPPLLEFDAEGKFLRACCGSVAGFDWPDIEQGGSVD